MPAKKVTQVDMDIAALKGQVNALMTMVERLNTVLGASLQIDAIDANLEVDKLEHEEKMRGLDVSEARSARNADGLGNLGLYGPTFEEVNKKIDQHLAMHEVEKAPTETHYYRDFEPDGDEYDDEDYRCRHGNIVLNANDCEYCIVEEAGPHRIYRYVCPDCYFVMVIPAGSEEPHPKYCSQCGVKILSLFGAAAPKWEFRDKSPIFDLEKLLHVRDREIGDLKAKMDSAQKYAFAAEKALIAKDEEITDLKAKNIVLQRYTEDEIIPKSPFGNKDIPEEWRYCWTCNQSFLSDVDSPPAKFCSSDGSALHSYPDESYSDDQDEYEEYEDECDDDRARRYCWYCGKIEEYDVCDDAPRFCSKCGNILYNSKRSDWGIGR